MDTALPFTAAEETVFAQRLQQSSQEVPKMLTIYEQRGVERGIEQGILRGDLQGRKSLLLKMMEDRFGSVPQAVRSRILDTTDAAELKQMATRFLRAQSVADMENDNTQ